jgi:predicted nucleic acid-binding protein
LLRALAYPKFGLSPAEQADLLADYLPWLRVVCISDPLPVVPACRDPHDRPFLELAAAGRARPLVSGDRDLLALGRVSAASPIMDLAAFRRRCLKS